MGLQECLHGEPVSNLPLREALVLDGDTVVRSAVQQMRAKGLGCAIVADPTGKPIGMFSEASLIDLLVNNPAAVDNDCVKNHLRKNWQTVKQSEPLIAVINALQEKKLRSVCITDDEGKPVAVTGHHGLVEYIAEHFPQQALVQRIGGKPGTTEREGA
jgi:predicted transcriptional regulator